MDFLWKGNSETNAYDCSHHHAHHLVKKAVAIEFNRKTRPGAPQTNRANNSDCVRFRRAAVRSKCCKVVFAAELLRRNFHALNVERIHHVPGATAFKRRQHARVPDAITIRFSFRGKSRVEFLGDKPAPHNANGRRQESVQRGDPPIGLIAALGQIHVRALRQRMDTRIGAPGAMHSHALRTNAMERFFQTVSESCCRWPGFAIRQTTRRRRKRSA